MKQVQEWTKDAPYDRYPRDVKLSTANHHFVWVLEERGIKGVGSSPDIEKAWDLAVIDFNTEMNLWLHS